jgi:hypothetical protein
MRNKWTREQIIRLILQCEAEGLPLTVGEPGISHSLYQAGARVFGSWRNAIQAAGLPPERGNCGEKWPPARILTIIRNLERCHHPLNVKQLEHRYGSMLSAARRLFGSWSKAVLAAGVDPTKLQRVVPWTRERVIEDILTRALRDESLAARSMQPRSLVAAGQRFFGSWSAALEVAGLDPKATTFRTTAPPTRAPARTPATGTEPTHRPAQSWTREAVIAAIQTRLRQQKPMNASALYRDDAALYLAARRCFSNWRNALIAAGLSPDDHRRVARSKGRLATPGSLNESARRSQADDAMRPEHPT